MNWRTYPMGAAANERTQHLRKPASLSHAVDVDTMRPLCRVKLASLCVDNSLSKPGELPDCDAATFVKRQWSYKNHNKTMKTHIPITPEMRRWNEAVERADAVLSVHWQKRSLPDPDEVALFNALCANGLYQTAEELLRAGEAVGYFKKTEAMFGND